MAINKPIIPHFKGLCIAKEDWDKIAELYIPKGFLIKFQIINIFIKNKFESCNNMDDFINKTKILLN